MGHHAQIIGNIVSTASNLCVGLPLPDNSDTAYFAKVLTVMRTAVSKGLLKNNERLPTRPNTCDLDNAIYLVEVSSVPQDARLRTSHH